MVHIGHSILTIYHVYSRHPVKLDSNITSFPDFKNWPSAVSGLYKPYCSIFVVVVMNSTETFSLFLHTCQPEIDREGYTIATHSTPPPLHSISFSCKSTANTIFLVRGALVFRSHNGHLCSSYPLHDNDWYKSIICALPSFHMFTGVTSIHASLEEENSSHILY